MKKIFSICLFLFLIIGCASENSEKGKILVRVNDYTLTLKEFQKLFAEELAYDSHFKPTRSAREEFLESLIRKELMIQEAVRLRLDRKEKFVKSIERYWEATLIKDLLELKNTEVQQTTYVTQEEIDREYESLKPTEERIPPGEIEDGIRDNLTELKKEEMIEKWISGLRKSGHIEINWNCLEEGRYDNGE
ncbi:MAG: SurA N-terminal domain-containing protein [Proteobacteria bacterium]|nr:SurA N-terminal domain-containing protein [Pseudomonadota bacterium]